MLAKDTLTTAWTLVTSLRGPLVLWNLFAWAIGALLLGPLSSAVLGLGLFRGGEAVVGNDDLLAFLLSPMGLLYLVIGGSLAISVGVVRFAGIFRIVTDHVEGYRPTIFRTVLGVAARGRHLARLCPVIVSAAVVLAVPYALIVWLIYEGFLGEYDINYYLSIQPPEWTWLLIAGGLWSLVWIAFVIVLLANSILAVPEYLDGYSSIRETVVHSWLLTRNRAHAIVPTLIVAIVLWILVRIVLDALFLWVSAQSLGVLAGITSSVRVLAGGGALAAFGALVLDTTISIFGFSFVSVVLSAFYFDKTQLHDAAPGTPPSGASSRQESRPHTRPHTGPHARLHGSHTRPRTRLQARLHITLGRMRRVFRPLPVAGLAVVLVAASFLAGNAFMTALPDPREVAIAAHRGGPPPAPENTPAALERAIEEEADFSEIDVQLTGDGTPVIAHDADLMRVAGDPRRIAASDYSELAGVVQHPDDGSPASDRRLATLGDFLERARGRIRLMIELKYYGFDEKLAQVVVDEVRAADMEEQIVIMSLNLRAIRQLNEIAPELTLGYVSAFAIGDIRALPVDFVAVTRQAVTPSLVRGARDRNMAVHAWTINTPAAMAELIDRGVDGLITDYPARAAAVHRELAEMSVPERMLLRFGNWVAANAALEQTPVRTDGNTDRAGE